MSERFRNDLYYVERLSGEGVVLYPDGTVGSLKEKKVKVEELAPGRRPDRPRRATRTEKRLVSAARFASASEYLAAYNKELAKRRRQYPDYSNDTSWSLDDMPDETVAQFEQWQNSLGTPSAEDILEAAQALMVDAQTAQEATIDCPDCRHSDRSQYACRSCGYAGAYYRYPLVRLVGDAERRDVPFDVARLIASDPEALSFEVRTKFDYEGKMSAEQVVVLRPNRISGTYLNQDGLSIEEADALNTEIVLTVAAWQEEGQKTGQPVKVVPKEPQALIPLLQDHIATRVAREQTDTPRYQELYDEFLRKIRKLGGGSLLVAFRGRYDGMGESSDVMSVARSSDDFFEKVWSSSELKWLIEEVAATLDTATSISDIRAQLIEELRRRYDKF